ncbi:hypothetical protein Leryth_003337 [Lithospermum erythrorhizon]|nr:hypothetical protein Leryth_003337 [Lithospermum erythrorhizon]
MAASTNPSGGSNNNGNSNEETNNNGNGAVSDNGVDVQDNSILGPTIAALRHDSGISIDWNSEEQSLLNELLTKYASEVNVVRYAKIAMQMKDKTSRDVALRCKWMSKKENGKRRKEDHSRKNKDKKEKVTDPSQKPSQGTSRANGPPYAQPVVMSTETDDGISFKDIGGTTGQLLEQNALALDQISGNFTSFKIHENINLFCQARNNILTILNDSLNDLPEVMKQMPPLPVKLNEELANSILPRPPLTNN